MHSSLSSLSYSKKIMERKEGVMGPLIYIVSRSGQVTT